MQESLVAKVHTEFRGVISNHLRDVVADLVGVADLRQFTFKIVAERETSGNGDERNAFTIRSEVRSNAVFGITGLEACVSKGIRRIGSAVEAVGHSDSIAGINYVVGPLRMEKCPLGLTEVSDSRFVYGAVADRPCVRQIDLLHAGCIIVPESTQQTWRSCLKPRKRL